MNYKNPVFALSAGSVPTLLDEYSIWLADAEKIKKAGA
jgi:hypothetical protein